MILTCSRSGKLLSALLNVALASGLGAAVPANSRAQSASPPPVSAQPLGASTDLVRLEVSVLEKRGDFVGGLAKGQFRVLDNGVPQPIVFFAPIEAPARVLVVIETSPAVYLIHDEHLSAAYALLQGLDPADQVALVTYSDRPYETLGLTTDKSALLGALNSLQYTMGMGTLNFYDSLATVVDHFGRGAGKSAVVLLTTGIDSSPVSRWEPLVRKLQGTDLVIFPIALGGVLRDDATPGAARNKRSKGAHTDDSPPPDSLGQLTGFARANRALNLLAQITGGRAYFPQSNGDFLPIYREIASALRHQYVLGIAPANDGQFHSLEVQVSRDDANAPTIRSKKSPYRIFAREGYIAPGK